MNVDAPALPRRERERLARRAAMLDAALVVFAEKGFVGATLDEIAERAEFGKGTLYNYFPDGKDELFMTLFRERVAAGLEGVVAQTLPPDVDVSSPAAVRAAFHGLVLGLIEHFHNSTNATLMFMKEGHRSMPAAPQNMAVFAEHFARIIDGVALAVQRAVDAGTIRALPAHPVAHLIMGNVRGYIMGEVDADCDPTGTFEPTPFGAPGDAADFITTVLFDGLLAETR